MTDYLTVADLMSMNEDPFTPIAAASCDGCDDSALRLIHRR